MSFAIGAIVGGAIMVAGGVAKGIAANKQAKRARGRAASLKIENTSTGQSWRYGTFRADVQPDGRR